VVCVGVYFGVVAMLLFYFSLFNWITEWGWDQGLMAHREIRLDRAASTHLFIRIMTGLLPVATIALFYPWLSMYISPERWPVVLGLAGANLLEKIAVTYRVVLEREYQLKRLAFFEFVASVASFACAVVAARAGMGAMSLVVQRMVERGVMLVGYIWASPWRWGIGCDLHVIRLFFNTFGVATWMGGVFGLSMYDFMPFLIGFFAGTHESGLYAKAFSLSTFPLMLTAICSRLASPLYAQFQGSVADLRRVFIRVQTFKLLVLVPFQLLLLMTARVWIPKVLGPKWTPLVPVYMVMTVYGLFRAFFDDVPNLFTLGFKNPWELAKNQVVQSIGILLAGVPLVIFYNSLGGAIVMSGTMVIGTVLLWKNAAQLLTLRGDDFVQCCLSFGSIVSREIKKMLRRIRPTDAH